MPPKRNKQKRKVKASQTRRKRREKRMAATALGPRPKSEADGEKDLGKAEPPHAPHATDGDFAPESPPIRTGESERGLALFSVIMLLTAICFAALAVTFYVQGLHVWCWLIPALLTTVPVAVFESARRRHGPTEHQASDSAGP